MQALRYSKRCNRLPIALHCVALIIDLLCSKNNVPQHIGRALTLFDITASLVGAHPGALGRCHQTTSNKIK